MTEVFRFVATEHFQNHPKWDPAVTSITQTSPGPMGVGTTARLVRTDRGPAGRRQHGGHRVPAGPQLHRGVPIWPVHAARSGDVGARRAVEHQTGAGDRYPRPGVIRLLLPLMKGTFRKTMARSLRSIKQQVEATASPTT
jgi:hypothetical protein